MANSFDDTLAKLPADHRAKLAKAALHFPRIARGHGGRRRCNATNCDGSNHTQERIELAYKVMGGK